MGSANNITTCDQLEITSRQGEIEARTRVSDSALTGSVFLPSGYATGAAHVLTYTILDPTTKIAEFRISAAKLSKLN